MLRFVRRQLRLIGYYSAPRKRSRRSIVFERATVIALLLCIPVAYLVDRSVNRVQTIMSMPGRLVVDDAGTYHAGFVDDNANEIDPLWAIGDPVAEFDAIVESWNHGWPVTTSQSLAPMHVSFKPYNPQAHPTAALAKDPGARAAIDALMQQRPPILVLSPFRELPASLEESPRVHSPFGWVYASLTWFLFLAALLFGLLFLYAIGKGVLHTAGEMRRSKRQQRGQCARCGYDLTGLEFSERCPECGELVE